MPYKDPARARAYSRNWDKAHRAKRSAEFLERAHFERGARRARQLIEGYERGAQIDDSLERRVYYEALLNRVRGNGNPRDDVAFRKWRRENEDAG